MTLLVNKFLPADKLDLAASFVLQYLAGLEGDAQSTARYSMAMFAIARALVWRLHKVDAVVDRLFQLIQDPAFGAEAARGLKLLFAPDEVVSRDNGAVIRPLAKQRVFSICLPAIANAVRGAQSAEKANYLLALSGMLRHIDTNMLFPEMKTIVPLLLQTLDLDDSGAKNGAIKVLVAAIQEDSATLEEHAASLINRLLKIAASGETNDMVCRPFTSVGQESSNALRRPPGRMRSTF